MESRHLLNLSVQNTPDGIAENFNLKNFPGGACARKSIEKCAVRIPDGRYRVLIATVYYISRPPLSQNPPSAPEKNILDMASVHAHRTMILGVISLTE